jgi:hypothetical protein
MNATKIACAKSGNLRKVLKALRKSLFFKRNESRKEKPMTTQRKQSRNIIPLFVLAFWSIIEGVI